MVKPTYIPVVLLLIFSWGSLSAQKATYIANEGIMIEYGGAKILIDALFENKKPKFMAPESGVVSKMTTGKSPYHQVDLALVTHAHLDHFSAGLSMKFLKSNPKAQMIITGQAMDSLLTKPGFSELQSRVTVPPYVRKWHTYSEGSISVKSAYVKHAGKRNAKVQSLLFLITIGDKKILHLGDPDQDLSRFGYLNLVREQVDVVFVPFWYLTNFYGVELVKKYFAPKKIVGIHFPLTGSSKTLSKIKQQAPGAVVFTKTGQVVRF